MNRRNFIQAFSAAIAGAYAPVSGALPKQELAQELLQPEGIALPERQNLTEDYAKYRLNKFDSYTDIGDIEQMCLTGFSRGTRSIGDRALYSSYPQNLRYELNITTLSEDGHSQMRDIYRNQKDIELIVKIREYVFEMRAMIAHYEFAIVEVESPIQFNTTFHLLDDLIISHE